MSYAITLTTQDDEQINFECQPDQTIQEAAEAAGFFLPSVCNAGSCGACFGQCQEGKYRLGSFAPNLLPHDHQQQGSVLLCRTYPESDLKLTTLYHSFEIRSSHLPTYDSEITGLEIVAERTMRVVLKFTQPEIAFQFTAGQFVELEVPELNLKRAYSIANTPNQNGILEFLIRLQPQGQFSTFLQQTAKVGQHLNIEGPSGYFGIQEPSSKTRCFVAGGAGLAPFLSILRYMAETGEDHPTQLFFGVNTEQEIFCQQELEELQEYIPQLKVHICVAQASSNWNGFHGTSVDALKAYLENSKDSPDVFLCGPALMVDAATQIALNAGINEQNILSERFA